MYNRLVKKSAVGVFIVSGILSCIVFAFEKTGYLTAMRGAVISQPESNEEKVHVPVGEIVSSTSPDLPAGLELTVSPSIQVTPTNTPIAIPTVTVTSTPKPTPKVSKTPKPTATSTPTSTPVPTIDYSKPWTVAPNCPSSTQSCVPCTSGTSCRFEPGKTHGFLGWSCQNNNPGNIRNASTNMATDFKNLMITRNGGTAACGVRYDARGGSYFVFSTYAAGMGSLKAYVRGINNGEHSAYTGCGDCTIAFFFSKYAPGDPNYASYVANYIGVPTSQTIRYVVENNKLDGFAEAIKIHEGFFVQ